MAAKASNQKVARSLFLRVVRAASSSIYNSSSFTSSRAFIMRGIIGAASVAALLFSPRMMVLCVRVSRSPPWFRMLM
jgi:hypothetical protein